MGDQLLGQLHARSLVLDQHNSRIERAVPVADAGYASRRRNISSRADDGSRFSRFPDTSSAKALAQRRDVPQTITGGTVEGVVIDTNVFVAALFNRRSASARVLEGVREKRFRLIWNQPTRCEAEMILRRIPQLQWQKIAYLFRPEGEFMSPVDPAAFAAVPDPDDRKFAALSAAAKVPLVTSDKLLLAQRGTIGIEIVTPRDLLRMTLGMKDLKELP